MVVPPVHKLNFRPAFPDETSRAEFLESGQSWTFPESRWFVAVTDGPPERIVGVARFCHAAVSGEDPPVLDFRITPGPGGELAGNENAFLRAFLSFVERFPSDLLRYAGLVPEGDFLETLLEPAGFAIRYREQHFETPWDSTVERVGRVSQALQSHASPLAAAEIVPVRHLPLDAAVLSLLTADALMTEAGLRAIWNSPDPTRLDRDASACLVLNGETLGVVICADAGNHLRILAIVGREDIPGAQRHALPLLMDHAFQTCAGRGYQKTTFRANVETARQTVNLALRLGGHVTAEIRRWGKLRERSIRQGLSRTR